MAFSVQMPALGESVTEGTVTRWLKQEGDRVEVDEPLLEVSTDKVDTEIPSPAAGVLQRIVAAEDETVEVGGELAVIGDGDGDGDDGGGSSTAAAPAAESQPEQPEPAEEEPAESRSAEPAAEPEPARASSGSADSNGSGGGSGTAVTMPALGESVTEGTVTRWLKQVGDQVEVDEPLLEVSTDKVDTEIPSPVAGTLQEILANEDDTVEVGGQLAMIGGGGGASAPTASAPAPAEEEPAKAEPAKEEPVKAASAAPAEPASRPSEPAPESTDGAVNDDAGTPYVTPLVRKLAAEHGVNLSDIQGSGVGGRIRQQDAETA
ncbi:biotin/lipoyl-containing protein, partial [Pseudonocardia eucalypti]|uniref:biotin/lipoyl-containing protein n=1 Tax=Pseudonocardia eucalypti TaxID=648755 RepID=UPI0031E7DAAB